MINRRAETNKRRKRKDIWEEMERGKTIMGKSKLIKKGGFVKTTAPPGRMEHSKLFLHPVYFEYLDVID